MRLRNCIPVVLATVIFAACGQNSTKDKANADTVLSDTTGHTALGPSADVPVNTNVEIPEATRTAFSGKYPNATNVNWNRYEPYDEIDWTWAGWPMLDTTDYVVTYTDNGTEYRTWFDDQNNWIGTVYTLSDASALPPNVKAAVDKSYDGYTIASIKKENDKNRTAYEIKLEKGTDRAKILVDENGKIMKKVTTTDGVKTKEKNL